MLKLDSAFTYRSAGFTSFRHLLADAESRGVVATRPMASGSDVYVILLGDTEPAAPEPPASRLEGSVSIHSDLWRAILDWGDGAAYVFERDTSRTLPLAPEEHSDAKKFVRVPTVSRAEQIQWMAEFANETSLDAGGAELLSALNADNPARGFSLVLKSRASAGRRWKKYLRERVLERANDWATKNGIPAAALEAQSRDVVDRSAQSARSMSAEEDARKRILGLLSRLPLQELLRLRIPIEYALDQ
ncbi:UPF0158 family protein [Microbacterium sp. CIAB417]|uniref:UPF0158 family protein n=1 Tax=Microbacterium sp. CIAB417 TaxID=2860287 RepID=UPI001FAB8CF8|nr:UPF0158 family protein [Microbacterium sp. CIAB417]